MLSGVVTEGLKRKQGDSEEKGDVKDFEKREKSFKKVLVSLKVFDDNYVNNNEKQGIL